MYKLYWAPDTAALAPQAVLEEAGLPHSLELVDLRKDEQFAESYLKINPAGYVPSLVGEDGEVLHESAAIVLALCYRHGLTDLAPASDAPESGLFFRSLFFLTNSIQNIYKCYYYPERYSTDAEDAPKIKAKAREKLLERWRLVDAHLRDHGPFHLGERYSACDLYMVMLATWFEPPEVLFRECPAVAHCYDLAMQRPALAKVFGPEGEA